MKTLVVLDEAIIGKLIELTELGYDGSDLADEAIRQLKVSLKILNEARERKA